ncbi:hypothetical protein B0H11DRAFT_197080 [Mycena galericulata]|nr:hypothetical protein B0H11DRAFT_197080 [Mycena galericulata]
MMQDDLEDWLRELNELRQVNDLGPCRLWLPPSLHCSPKFCFRRLGAFTGVPRSVPTRSPSFRELCNASTATLIVIARPVPRRGARIDQTFSLVASRNPRAAFLHHLCGEVRTPFPPLFGGDGRLERFLSGSFVFDTRLGQHARSHPKSRPSIHFRIGGRSKRSVLEPRHGQLGGTQNIRYTGNVPFPNTLGPLVHNKDVSRRNH